MLNRLRRRLRGEGGFALIEVLIASTILAVGLLAVLASFSTGYLELNRANAQAAATMLADRTMESYRGKQFAALPAAGTTTVTYNGSSSPPSPDGNSYTVQTTTVDSTATNTSGATARAIKVITVTVTDNTSGRRLMTERSTFDSLTSS